MCGRRALYCDWVSCECVSWLSAAFFIGILLCQTASLWPVTERSQRAAADPKTLGRERIFLIHLLDAERATLSLLLLHIRGQGLGLRSVCRGRAWEHKETGDPVKLRVTGGGIRRGLRTSKGHRHERQGAMEGRKYEVLREEGAGGKWGRSPGGQVGRSHCQGSHQVNKQGGNPNHSERTITG